MKKTITQATQINFPETTVFSYPADSKAISGALIKVSGRHPYKEKSYFIETDLHVLFFIVLGTGTISINNIEHEVHQQDVITILPGEQYYVEGNLEYVAVTTPAYYPEQNKLIEKKS